RSRPDGAIGRSGTRAKRRRARGGNARRSAGEPQQRAAHGGGGRQRRHYPPVLTWASSHTGNGLETKRAPAARKSPGGAGYGGWRFGVLEVWWLVVWRFGGWRLEVRPFG